MKLFNKHQCQRVTLRNRIQFNRRMSSRLWKKNWKVVKLKIGSVRKHRLRTTCMMVMSKSNYTVLKKCRKNIHWIKLEFLGCLKAGSYFSGLWVSGFGICDVGCFSDQSDLSPINEIGQFICLSLNIYTYFLWVPDYILFSALQIRVILIPLWVHISAVIYETEWNNDRKAAINPVSQSYTHDPHTTISNQEAFL